MSTPDALTGALFIGDPHLASRVPGFRRDDYPRAILAKLRWCLDLAREQRLLPVLLGDLFHWPRDNANWLVGEVIGLLAGRGVVGIVGNHDTTEKQLTPDDTLAIIQTAGVLRLLDLSGPWRGELSGVPVMIGGTTWSERIPASVARDGAALVVWLAHHNIGFTDEDEGWMKPRPIEGVDLVVNGHIHTPKDDIVRGATRWMNPGNIARVQRADSVRDARPGVLRLDVAADGAWTTTRVEVPHGTFEDVFHALPEGEAEPAPGGSDFVRGLEELRSLRTEGGAGLLEFLAANLDQFESAVADEIRSLATEVCQDADT
jgi:predicted phosphodiesterase